MGTPGEHMAAAAPSQESAEGKVIKRGHPNVNLGMGRHPERLVSGLQLGAWVLDWGLLAGAPFFFFKAPPPPPILAGQAIHIPSRTLGGSRPIHPQHAAEGLKARAAPSVGPTMGWPAGHMINTAGCGPACRAAGVSAGAGLSASSGRVGAP